MVVASVIDLTCACVAWREITDSQFREWGWMAVMALFSVAGVIMAVAGLKMLKLV